MTIEDLQAENDNLKHHVEILSQRIQEAFNKGIEVIRQRNAAEAELEFLKKRDGIIFVADGGSVTKRAEAAEALAERLKNGICCCDARGNRKDSPDFGHGTHCPEQAALLMDGYCIRIRRLKEEFEAAEAKAYHWQGEAFKLEGLRNDALALEQMQRRAKEATEAKPADLQRRLEQKELEGGKP
jgi:hypothetical protein